MSATSAAGGRIKKMRRTIKAVVAMVVLLALTARVTLADTVDCSDNEITGSEMCGEIDTLGGVDTLNGKGGNDAIYGGPGGEVFIFGREGSDLLVGGLGRDNTFTSEFPDINPGVDTVRAGNDGIDAADGFKDVVNGGPGNDAYVEFDRGLDTVASNCEYRVPK